MTEAEWLVCDSPTHLLRELGGRMSERKFRLFECAWLSQEQLSDPRCSGAVAVAERFADGGATVEELARALVAAQEACADADAANDSYACFVAQSARRATSMTVSDFLNSQKWDDHIKSLARYNFPLPPDIPQANLIREIFGNPFRLVAFSPSWRTDTAVALARQMYEAREFSAMPILADALQDAGCDDESILNHCRSEGPHVRGCWVVDLVLGKE